MRRQREIALFGCFSAIAAAGVHCNLFMGNPAPFKEGLRFLVTGAPGPATMVQRSEGPFAGWDTIGSSHDAFEQQVRDAKWNFFFVAGAIRITAFGFDREKTVARSVKRLATAAQNLKCNSFEIDCLTCAVRLGVSRVVLSGHARHLQEGSLMSGA